jgi:predicted amidohydrolase
MTIFAVQFDIAWENKAGNFATVRRLLANARPPKDSLVVLPEMFATGFSMNVSAIAEPYGGETEQFLGNVAREFGVWMAGGAAMRGKDGRARNKCLVFAPNGELKTFYTKMRLFTPGGESEHYAAGEHTVRFLWQDCVVCPLVCYDLRFPELFRRAMIEHKAELFVVIANFPKKRIHHWVRLLQARAVENQAYVVGVNRIGADPIQGYPGHSLIVDPQGEILADAGENENVIRAELNVPMLRQYREKLPFLSDMGETK